ncbi:hypothetical protein R3P38DRAFT_2812331 [Favolaschia claudopus]|uniref:DUF6533 domain-containing protein n=1 Tax=Favolaschia claudopus TaxID=2862362 RepID=A0AAV9Z7E5_9AGAR
MSSPPTQTVSDLFTSAAASLIIYDHLLTLGDEIKLVWPHRTRLPKLLFFLSRYMIPAIEFCMWLSSEAICGYWHVAPLYIAMAAAEALIFCSQCKTVTKGIDERSQWMWWALVLMYSANLITVTFCVSEVIPAAGSGKDSCVLPEKPCALRTTEEMFDCEQWLLWLSAPGSYTLPAIHRALPPVEAASAFLCETH